MISLPDRALLNRRIPKAKFYEQIGVDSKLERKFIDEIDNIIWKYKLSQETTNLKPTKKVEEIQVLEISLKEKYISKEVLENIDRVIPYPILYILKYKDNIKLAIAYKERNKIDENKMVVHSYYQSEWIKEYELAVDILKGLSLEDVYDNLLRQLIPIENTLEDDIEKLIKLNEKQESLKKEIEKLEKKVKREKQFNRKVDLNIELQKKKKELEELLDKN
ncbi:DUF4391 domain-containing protein [Schnuerera ultunensis]|uniref:DUF4391 domain-containing protein n=1 Tax=Schnuerera ultunensis TaxID=45497 RepID=UPI000402BD0B|nr:DUF4391 domain-containing protein [Schnuerera ultunensis]